ncbi:unnamed protein product [Paramecium primaurelia]|uniref:Uncharacterized protein n=1 Tax=Paramecium primaurelia TaxID=5886 RepID=A0A8S1PMK7_PARPR|nr:unnamed protein product [Paramecium primaurelia]
MQQSTNQMICCSEHKMEAQLVILDQEMTQKQRLLCTECISKMEGNYRFLGFKKIKQIIEENQNLKNQIIDNVINQRRDIIQKFQIQMDSYRSMQIQKFDNIISQTNFWIQNLNEIKQKYQSSNFCKEFEILLQNNMQIRQIDEQQIYKDLQLELTFLISNYQPKLAHGLNELMETSKLFQATYSIFECFQNEEISAFHLDQITPKVEIKYMNKFENQDEWCYAIQFDKKGQRMISTSNKDIKLWSFNQGKLQLIQQLKGHLNNVTCLLFTPQSNCIISGSYDNTLRCWNLNEQNQLISQSTFKEHSGKIHCMILNQLGDELISSSKDKSIKIWKFDQSVNGLQLQQTLSKHQNEVYSVSLNQSENLLASCGRDQQVIIWKRDQFKKWQFNQIVTQSIQDFGKKLLFLNDEQLIWVTANNNLEKNSIWFYESKEGVFMENKEKTIHLDGDPNCDYISFPIQYNREKNLLIVRHKQIIYLLRQSLKGKFVIIAKLPCQDENSYGALSNDGRYLVFWDCLYQNKNKSNGKYLVIELSYK